jgi:hypothetical protein
MEGPKSDAMGHADGASAHDNPQQMRPRLCSPPSLWELAACVLISLLAIEGATEPSGRPAFVASCALGTACFIWPGGAILLAVAYVARLITCVTYETSSWRAWRWYVPPVFLILAAYAHQVDWPLSVRFENSRPAFAREAEILLANPPAPLPNVPAAVQNSSDFILIKRPFGRYVGSYYVHAIVVHAPQGVVYFFTGQAESGFLFAPEQDDSSRWRQRLLGDGWWTFHHPLGWS